ncbi:LysR family transcriptional regulator [Microbacterium immunditiarum]|uniref:DNA-binding transcriptional LysR family regulator n=1 Tax=Microbacterium immunditiarum TaxID=337480 RepID=A0A7Y9GR84_9MICO|nr:LysR substrate-binding domain-containing protein [Microbacterium immunditiarum]NYE20921.1 DNA-binding transcriptional LysR family regulator [Microbacterium immunditiarum]
MDVHKARAFLAVAEELHFGRAARRLHIAQPPLSRMIRSIEQELGATLFERGPRRVTLTPVGEALVEPARSLVMQSERITEIVRRMQRGESGRVSLGFSGASVNAVVGALVGKVRRDAPELTLDLRGSQLSEPGLERLLAGGLDAILGRWDRLPPEVESCILAEEELLVALPAGHPLATSAELAPEPLADEPWVVLPGGTGATLSNRLHLLGTRGGFVPRIVETAVDSATQLLMVDAGAGLALTFSGVSESIPVHDVVFRPVRPSLGPVEVRLAWRRADPNPALAKLIALAASLNE